ncbi:hypothetical protein LWI28_008810 [Acer negundo]|uniref:Uncharacterized protein n=1 Tax=Acer negundo TaxID=4023 RepID=A0AAD5NIL4_ACENE|nr:hypothetical protein LWI28_008810 [Acer negundo]KAK4839474.1 hypothetical protein QYF36_022233 [Acer negundo]
MDQDQENPSSSLSRKPRRFRPKIRQPSSDPQLTVPTPEPKKEDDAEVQARRRLLRQFNEAKARQGGPKVEKTSSVQVAFGPGASSSSSTIRTFGVRKDGNSAKGTTGSGLKHSTSDDRHIVISSSSTAKEEGSGARSSNALPLKVKKDYREPWDYAHTYYPTTLPWRPPYSGDPELLDGAEFGEEATRELEYAENAINAASDLSLLDDSEEKKMMIFQFPANLPLNKRPASIRGKEKVESSSTSSGRVGAPKAGLNGLSGGYMGKLLVYQSGAIKLKLGDTLYDVSPGSDGSFAQDLVAINTEEKNCCVLGELGKRAVVAPDIDSLFP